MIQFTLLNNQNRGFFWQNLNFFPGSAVQWWHGSFHKSLEDAADDLGFPGGVDVLGGQNVPRRVKVEPVGHVAGKLLRALRVLLLELLLAQKLYLVEEPLLGTTLWKMMFLSSHHRSLLLSRVAYLGTYL